MNLDDIKLSPLEYHDVTVFGDRQPRYAQGGIVRHGSPEIRLYPGECMMRMIDISVRVTCDYCRSTHNYLASNCRNCGAPL